MRLPEQHREFLLDFEWSKDKLFSEIHLISKIRLAKNIDLSKWYDLKPIHRNDVDKNYPLSEEIKIYERLQKSHQNNLVQITINQTVNEI